MWSILIFAELDLEESGLIDTYECELNMNSASPATPGIINDVLLSVLYKE
mgnify:CR=1 FL=1